MQASRDENNVPTLLGASQSDGITPIRIKADPVDRTLKIDDNVTGSNLGPQNAPRDENSVPVLMGVSSADGETPVIVYATIDGSLLVKST